MTRDIAYPINPREKRRVAPVALLAGYWLFLFVRSPLTDLERDPLWIAELTAWPAQFVAPAMLLAMLAVVGLEAPRFFAKGFAVLWCLILAMAAWFILSTLANDAPPLNTVQFLFGYLKYFALVPFVVLCLRSDPVNFRLLTKVILLPLTLQFAVNLAWFLQISPLQNTRRDTPNNIDWAYGTLTSPSEIAGISSILLFFALHVAFLKPRLERPIPRGWLTAASAAALLQFFWADSKLSYLSLSAGLGLVMFGILKTSLLQKLAVAMAGVGVMAGIFLLSVAYNLKFNSNYVTRVGTLEMAHRTLYGARLALANNPKIEVFLDLTWKLPEMLDFPALGGGPGTASSRFAIKSGRPLAEKFLIPRIEFVAANGNSMLLLPNSGVNALIGDLGWMGALLYYTTLSALLLRVFRNYRSGRYGEGNLESTWAFVFLAFGTYFLLHSWIDDKLYVGTEAAFFWIMGTLLFDRSRQPARNCTLVGGG